MLMLPMGWNTLPKSAPLLSTPSSFTLTSRCSSRVSTKKRASLAKGAASSLPSSPRRMEGHWMPESITVIWWKLGRSITRSIEPVAICSMTASCGLLLSSSSSTLGSKVPAQFTDRTGWLPPACGDHMPSCCSSAWRARPTSSSASGLRGSLPWGGFALAHPLLTMSAAIEVPSSRLAAPISRPVGVADSTQKVTRFPMTDFRRNSRAAHANGWSGVPLRLPRRGEATPDSEICFSGGGPLLASAPMMMSVSPLSTPFTMPFSMAG
mmetsp:Transcript_37921/g.96296  ORF Transcript_37921/g.96296 Transcript_37921/m.96296 type:complete len:266 (+) Transcript_37921:2191-2988(+)